MANSIDYTKDYTDIIDRVYQRAATSSVLNSGRRMVRAGRNAKEVMIPKISVTGLGDYTRNVGYKTGVITYEFETKTFNYDRGIRLMADVMDVEEAGVLDCFVEAGSELQCSQVAPEADAFTYAQIASHEGVTVKEEDLSSAKAVDVLGASARRHLGHGRGAGLDRLAHPLHHADAQGDARRLRHREHHAQQPRDGAVQPRGGGAAGSLLHGHRPALRRLRPVLVRQGGHGQEYQLHGREEVGRDQVRQARGVARVPA